MAGLKHGHGTERFANGDFFMGAYENGKPNGFGEYYWSNGCNYKGFFKNGLRHGTGTWRKGFGKSDVYEGEWINDKKCGTGTYTWLSGNCYKGEYFDDLRHGYGEMSWVDGSVYKGQWRRGLQHGEGELYTPGRQVLRGKFRQNMFCGVNEEDVNADGQGSLSTHPTDPNEEEKLPPLLEKSFKLNDQRMDFLPHRPTTGKRDFAAFRGRDRLKEINESRTSEVKESSITLTKETSYYQNTSPSEFTPYEGSNAIRQSTMGSTHNRNWRSISPSQHSLLRNGLAEKTSNGRSISNPRAQRGDSKAKLNQTKSSFRTLQILHVKEDRTKGKDSKSPSPSRQLPNLVNVRPLDAKELLRWNIRKPQLILTEQKKYENLDDPQVILGIREIINPPVWKQWPAHIISPANLNPSKRGTSTSFYSSKIQV